MKKFFSLLVLLIFITIQAFSATDSSVVFVKRGALPPEILKKFEQATVNVTKVENIMNAVADLNGKVDPREIGTAIDTISTILSRQSNHFAESRVGKFTIGLILWRVFGVGFSSLILKTIFAVVAFVMFCVMWKRNFMTKKFIKSSKIITPYGWFPWIHKTEVVEYYEFKTPHDLLVENDKNDFNSGADEGPGPETLSKVLTLVFLLISFFVLLWA